jgi:hypothetical protein
MDRFKIGGIFHITCYDKNGNIKWKDVSKNLVVNVGLEHILDGLFSLGGVIANPNYYLGLTDGSPNIVAGDTLSSHTGWNEVSDYTETTRQAFTPTRTGLTVDNSAAKAVFSINASAVVGGAFITSVDTGTTGLLLAVSAFSNGDKTVSSGDTIEVQYDFSASSS